MKKIILNKYRRGVHSKNPQGVCIHIYSFLVIYLVAKERQLRTLLCVPSPAASSAETHCNPMAQTSFSMSRLVDDLLSELPELFGPADRCKEIGLAAIFLYYHSIVALVERNPKYGALPPVLISTLSVLAGLGLVHSTVGPEVTAELVEYFNPSVQFLGNYMSLWLVPPMVLLPSAISRIPNAKAVTWVKLIVVHFRYVVRANRF